MVRMNKRLRHGHCNQSMNSSDQSQPIRPLVSIVPCCQHQGLLQWLRDRLCRPRGGRTGGFRHDLFYTRKHVLVGCQVNHSIRSSSCWVHSSPPIWRMNENSSANCVCVCVCVCVSLYMCSSVRITARANASNPQPLPEYC